MQDWRKMSIGVAGTAVVGVSAGVTAVLFHWAMEWPFDRAVSAPSRLPWLAFAACVVVIMAAAAALTGFFIKKYAPDAPGSGIPQVKMAYHHRQLDFTWKLIFVKFFGGALSIGTGSSLGREGPSIHIGAAIASKVAQALRLDTEAKANAICAGSAAGLAAAFGSPLAGVTLVLEEIAGGKNMAKFSGPSLFAAAMAVSAVFVLTGDVAALPIGEDLLMTWKVLWLSPVVAIVAGSVGLIFQAGTLGLRGWCKKSRLPMPVRLALGAALGGILAAAAFAATGQLGVFGLGEETLQAALQNRVLWTAALWLLLAKVAATMLCYGTGGCGGIFAPIVFFGGMAGLVVHGIFAPWLGLTPQEQILLSLVGMTSCLGAVVRAPLTSILIVMEMTWQIHVLPALMVGAVISTFMNRLCFRGNFYDAALQQDGVKTEWD